MTYALSARTSFEFELAQFGETVTFRRTVAGEIVEQSFRALVAELGAQDATEHELLAYQRLATLDLLIDAEDTNEAPVSISVPGVIVIIGEKWQVIRMAGRDHGEDAVTVSWRLGIAAVQRMAARP